MTHTRYTTSIIGLLFIGGFIVLYNLMQPALLAELLNGIVFSLSCAVVVAYVPTFWSSLTHPSPGRKELIMLGVIMSWIAIGLARGESMIWRAMGKPEWLTDHWSWISLIYLNIMAAILHIAAPGAVDGVIPKRNWIWAGVASGIGVFIALFVIWSIGAGELPISRGKRDV